MTDDAHPDLAPRPAADAPWAAHWVRADLILAPRQEGGTWTLWAAPEGGPDLAVVGADDDGAGPAGVVRFALVPVARIPADVVARHPHLAGLGALRFDPPPAREQVEAALTGRLVLTCTRRGRVVLATAVQHAGVLDDLFAAAAHRTLGLTWAGEDATFALWAPTAKEVTLLAWPPGVSLADPPRRVAAAREADGTWLTRVPGARGLRYRYEVRVYVPATGRVERNVVTCPSSVALTCGSTHSVAVDLTDPAWQPQVWRRARQPRVRPVDQTIYELHVRDFSVADPLVPAHLRGTYLAFTCSGSHGMRHLRRLAEAGMTTVHLLPTFDIATIPEDRAAQASPGDLSGHAPDSPVPQAAIAAVADRDAFNWGYDPLHWYAPEGSYAVEPDGGTRVAEFRTMVGALHEAGLQVVLDQVFNHTAGDGQGEHSILDKVVPGYYHRLDPVTGRVQDSACNSDIAVEHAMAGKHVVDAVVSWARHYRVDGFRFDLMGHHPKANLLAVRAALDALTVERDGVDGSAVYLYGEGWDFGEVAGGALFEQATQANLAGTGIGTFSDRLRDAVQGGTPTDGSTLFAQGFATGLYTDPNGRPAVLADDAAGPAAVGPEATGPAVVGGDDGPVAHGGTGVVVHDGDTDVVVNDGGGAELARLRHLTDLLQLGLAGNLRTYRLRCGDGVVRSGAEIVYSNDDQAGSAPQAAGYAQSPQEVVTYVDAHDNETLFDLGVLKLPVGTAMADRVRMNTVALATTALAQTPSFWHAGTDLLRSKSLDRNSYNAGDWFNAIDWTGADNGFGRGLPGAAENADRWPYLAGLLANPDLRPGPADIAAAHDQALDLLRLRFSTPLLRLGSAALIHDKVSFPLAGPEATPGVVVMHVDDTAGAEVDPALDGVLVAFNASPHPVTQRIGALTGRRYELSPVQQAGADLVVRHTTWDATTGTLTLPPRTVAVLVEPQRHAPGTLADALADREELRRRRNEYITESSAAYDDVPPEQIDSLLQEARHQA